MNIKTASEKELRESEVPTFDTPKELYKYIDSFATRHHDYGTCVYAMSMASVATFNYIARKLGVTGFQASCADLDILKRIRRMQHGFRVVDYDKLLYPQYWSSDHFPTPQQMLTENIKELAKAARELLKERGVAHPDVVRHWEWIVSQDKED